MNICTYCGQEYYGSQLTRDHIIPRVQNGKDIWNNVVTSCCACNKHKGGKTPEQAGMKLLYVPCINEFIILKYCNILFDQMDFLLKNIKTKNTRIYEIIKGE